MFRSAFASLRTLGCRSALSLGSKFLLGTGAAFATYAAISKSNLFSQLQVLSLQDAHCDSKQSKLTWPEYTSLTGSSETGSKMERLTQEVQRAIVEAVQELEPTGTFLIDGWQAAPMANQQRSGVSCVLEDGSTVEKGAVNVTISRTPMPLARIKQAFPESQAVQNIQLGAGESADSRYALYSASISLIIHPVNPNAPTVHANFRFFEVRNTNDEMVSWWFGGGADLTPVYLFPEDCTYFHKVWKRACDKHRPEYYPNFKRWCDQYFTLHHRSEARGIGGIFFDYLADGSQKESYAFVADCARSFVQAYVPLLAKRKDMPYTQNQVDWQRFRRSRYVEFNLLHDKGTKYGLQHPSPRVDSILASMPRRAEWKYKYTPPLGSEEDRLVQVLKKPQEWL